MRILTWNINGVRTLPQYHPWNKLKSWDAILDELGASIACLQEMKTTRQQLDRSVALPESYDSFFSFPIQKGGYSGVAVYTKRADAVPLKAEEGLSARLQPKPPLTNEEQVSGRYPDIDDFDLMPNDDGSVPQDVFELDAEGRALVLDFGLFVLINLYCPAETSEARTPFKMNFHRLLGERVRILRAEGREVMIVGDINICSAPIDHCDFTVPSTHSTFYERAPRVWMQQLLQPHGEFVDVHRRFWPDRKGMYTCWNTRINARDSNYGTRIDYVLVTAGLVPWLKHADIQPLVKGSDHCPVYVDLHDEIVAESGERLVLRDAMKQTPVPRKPPRIAACYWDCFSTKQMLVSTFFGKGASKKNVVTVAATDEAVPVASKASASDAAGDEDASFFSTPDEVTLSQESTESTSTGTSTSTTRPTAHSDTSKPSPRPGSNKAKLPRAKKPSQTKLSSFFKQPSASASPPIPSPSPPKHPSSGDAQIDADYEYALLLAAESEAGAPPPSTPSNTQQSKSAWSTLLAPVKPPNCDVHGEPALRLTTTKPGPNKGKVFYLCSRPLGPGYDAGRGKRLREEVDVRYKCDFFKWESDVKRAALRSNGESSASASSSRPVKKARTSEG
ncbi:DNase I-like protein [Exidia glandulosa HHB12029]|uniref:DNA-(apurinic or apyrimidinic site) endonuclease n=1 Tax=Exidia glandulosa HHB12029 TaxID=1314781 RepID=A0A165M5A3_EXIGL|nr:DNase I-like protein [Exidia glandulosa HHB12029]